VIIGPYATPQAFRNALESRLRNKAQQQGMDLRRLYRRVAFERLLARLFAEAAPPWLLKGGHALELRFDERARTTLDLDLTVPNPAQLAPVDRALPSGSWTAVAYTRVQQAAARYLEDGFEFWLSHPQLERTGAPDGGLRCLVEARLAGRTFTKFHLDVGLGDAVLPPVEWVEYDSLLAFAGIPTARVALYPVEQQFAEKVHAYTFPWGTRENTRVKDLVDLVLLITSGLLNPEQVRIALYATFKTRGTHDLPSALPAPPSAWADTYLALAQEFALPVRTLEGAYKLLCAYWREHGF
jgi:predicted nucleotidyltransferase component of viral defense system